ncbi:MAG: hypothetical protein KFB93_07180 [Simkaniaceae bacterium]|nr:MAG: hypothetical protein KFB93_07180 [Simkaniaceae bacterium]
MSSPLTFSAACSQLGNAAYGVACAAWRAPFTGGKIRMVTIGLPVLFVTAATGAVTYAVMTTILSGVYIRCRRGARSFARYFENRNVKPIVPESRDQQRRTQRRHHAIPTASSPRELARQDRAEEALKPVILAPLPANAAKERNEALLKFLNLVDKYLIDPWVIKNEKLLLKARQTDDPFLNEMIQDPAALRAWLRSIALWQLGVQWDQLETKFVKMETPEPPTLKSLELQVQTAQLEAPLTETLTGLIRSEEEGRVQSFQEAVTRSGLPREKQMTLMAISLQLNVIISQAPVDPRTQAAETDKIRQKFAIVMHSGMAISLSQTSLIIEGWMTVVQQISSPSPRLTPHDRAEPPREMPEDLLHSIMENKLQRMVRQTAAVLSGELSEKYLLPLWGKQGAEWEHSIGEGLGREEVAERSPAHTLVNRFINGEISEETFLQAAESYGLSTALTSNLSFFRAIRIMQAKGVSLEATIKTLPASLLFQLEPLLVGTLHKTSKILSEINFATTVPKVVDYALDLLGCCRAMQTVREEAPAVDEEFSMVPSLDGRPTPLMEALTKGNAEAAAADVNRLFLQAPPRTVTGKAIIEQLGSRAHKAVRLSQSDIQERTWIHTTKERLEGLLRVKAAEYTQEPEGQWLATLLKSKPNGSGGTSLIGSLLSMQHKLWKLVPGMESIAKILMMGIQTFVEEEACEAVQDGLNDLTSTGFLSATIGKTLVKGLIDQSKDPRVWKENLPLLQQAYAFLSPDEQKLVLKHLEAQPADPTLLETRRRELITHPRNSREQNASIERMLREEAVLAESLEAITHAYDQLKQNKAENEEEIASLQEAYSKLKREKDLKQFERIKGLVIYVADSFLEKKLTFTGGGSLKQIILAVIHEAYTLLSYQEVVKHWIFTIVDLLLDELEEATSPRRVEPDLVLDLEEAHASQTPSILEFIQPGQQRTLLNQLVELMETSTKQEASGWLSVGAWMKTGARAVTRWAPDTIWGYIETAFKEDLRVTPLKLTEMALEKLEAFTTNPTGLADSVLQVLVEKVADPRSRKVIEAEERRRGSSPERMVIHDAYEAKDQDRDGAGLHVDGNTSDEDL